MTARVSSPSRFARAMLMALPLALALVAPGLAAQALTSAAQTRAEGPSWAELSAEQRHLLQAFESQWNTWSGTEKSVWLSVSARFPAMAPADQLKARQRIRQWALLSAEQRQIARANYGLARRLPEQQRVEQWHRYQEMTPEQRSVLRTHGWTSNTAARFAGSRTGLAKEAARPLAPTPSDER